MTRVRYRLMVEGWPEEFVTDPSITHATNRDGRTIVAGLSYQGLKFSERVIPLEAKIQASGMNFRITPVSSQRMSDVLSTDPITASLSTIPAEDVCLAADIDDTETTISASASLSDGVYHIGTEAIEVDTYPTIIRNKWSTLPQTHRVGASPIFITTRPPTMEGRRCYLYEYTEASDVAGDGTLVWRGVVASPPRLDRDQQTWLIQANPITYLLNQTIGGGYAEAKPVGLYFSWQSAFYCKLYWTDDPTYDSYDFQLTGLYTEGTLIDAVNSNLATALGLVGTASSNFSSVRLEHDAFGWSLVAEKTTGTNVFLGVQIGSYATGYASTMSGRASSDDQNHWVHTATGIALPIFEMVTVGQYRMRLSFDRVRPVYNRTLQASYDWEYDGAACALALEPGPWWFDGHQAKTSVEATHPSKRIYLDQDFTGVTSVHVSDVKGFPGQATVWQNDAGHVYDVTATGTTAIGSDSYHYIDIDAPDDDPWVLNGSSKITVLRSYATNGSVVDFVDSIVAQSINANDGDTPFLTYADVSNALTLSGDTQSRDVTARRYAFTKQLPIGDILSRDLQLCAHFMRLASDGRIEFAPIVVPTYGTHTETIGHSDILTPPSGSWPLIEPQRDGAVMAVSVQQTYDAVADDWTDQPISIVNGDTVATHKNRGRGRVEIKTYSAPVFPPEYAFIEQLATRFMAFGSRDYIVVTVDVPRGRLRDLLCGQVVALTHRSIPDGNGNRGVVDAPAVVIERRWNFDPASEDHGTLVLWMLAKQLGGYCPSGLVTSQTNTSGDTWAITLSSANASNIAISTASDGVVASAFAVNDRVRVEQLDSYTPTTVTGTVDSVSGNVVTVTFDATWTPGTDSWVLQYISDSDAQGDQLRQVFMADMSLATPAGLRRLL